MILFYLARPIYGGWVSFTAHLALKENLPLYKLAKKTEVKLRNFGYGVKYRNLAPTPLLNEKILITALDSHYHEHLDKFPDGTGLVLHDPTEVRGMTPELLRHLRRFRLFTIRKSVQDYLTKKLQLQSTFLVHPFYPYPYEKSESPSGAISISRIDFDKHTDIILEANKTLQNPVELYGAINRMYVFHKLGTLNFGSFYKGKFDKSFLELSDLLKEKEFVVDLSIIKNDGGGSQYTFLEAIHQDCILVLHKEWLEGKETVWKPNVNCLAVANAQELIEVLTKDWDYQSILSEAKKVLQPHLDVQWRQTLELIL